MNLPTSDGGALAPAVSTVASAFTWHDFWVAVAGAAALAFFALLVWLFRMAGEITEHDRRAGEINEDLTTWTLDYSHELQREVESIREELSKSNLLYSGTYIRQVGDAKATAFHRYRDQERAAKRELAALRDAETWIHWLWRAIRKRRRGLDLTAPADVGPILAEWAVPLSRQAHGNEQVPFVDPRARTVESVVAELRGKPLN